jgi:hypothetical protein
LTLFITFITRKKNHELSEIRARGLSTNPIFNGKGGGRWGSGIGRKQTESGPDDKRAAALRLDAMSPADSDHLAAEKQAAEPAA